MLVHKVTRVKKNAARESEIYHRPGLMLY